MGAIIPKASTMPPAESFTLRLALLKDGATIFADGEVRVEQDGADKILLSGEMKAETFGAPASFVLYGASGVRMVGLCDGNMTSPRCASEGQEVTVWIALAAPYAAAVMGAMRKEAA